MAPLQSGEPDSPRARSYQLEMFEASLKDNIIVAMGTGSGKTHIALLRIMHELEHSPKNKLIWFLAPTVALCLQQHKVISQHIPTAKSRTILGLDKVDLWTEQAVWDAVLKNIQVVVSTPAVLLDAMTHAFVRIGGLGLIVFDEAHHCRLNHPANMVMKLFYHPALAEHGPSAVPRILGLTASAASNREELRVIESNLGSICTTPQTNRTELLEHTHTPQLVRVTYTPLDPEGASLWGGTVKALEESYDVLDIENDPCVKKLRMQSPNGPALRKVLETGSTYRSDQLKKFVRRAVHIFTELGTWAAEYFIWASTAQLRGKKDLRGELSMDLDDDEVRYLVSILCELPPPNLETNSNDPNDYRISPKFEALISFLLGTEEKDFSGLIFVQQRATVAVMTHLLSIHPSTKDRFRTGGFIGMSNSTKKKDMLGDLLTTKMQRDTLDDFRAGHKNLIVTTDALEEGIDVSACSVVMNYDKTRTLKSFVQRRGRARRQYSTYAMVLSEEDDVLSLKKWQNFEKLMEDAYREDRRRLEEARDLEKIDEDVHALFRVKATGAILTADNAMQHLYHFCSHLPKQTGVENKPEFSLEEVDGKTLRGKVTLPSCVHPKVRRAEGRSWWKNERAARKEAAFEAYKALHIHGLVNDNLLPLTKSKDFMQKDVKSLPAIQNVLAQYDPWVDWAHAWSSPNIHQSKMIIRQGRETVHMRIVAPAPFPTLEPMTLFWDHDTTYTVEFEPVEPVSLTRGILTNLRAVTALYLEASSTRRISDKRDFVTLFCPDVHSDQLADWLKSNQGHEPAMKAFNSKRSLKGMGVVRNHAKYGEMLLFKRWVEGPDGLEIECEPYPQRRNFLQQIPPKATSAEEDNDNDSPRSSSPPKQGPRTVPAKDCSIDLLPASSSLFGRFIPVILDRLEATLITTTAHAKILPTVPFKNIGHITTALSMPLAQAPTDYQRYEFFGDSVLKFSTAASLYFEHPNWHEGYLTIALHSLVSNGRLAMGAMEKGIERFIMSRQFTPKRWVVPTVGEKVAVTTGEKDLSTKVLADVVEALIGAAYMDGGIEKAKGVIKCFLPESKLNFPHVDEGSSTGTGSSSDTDVDMNMDINTNTPSTPSKTPSNTPTQPHLINHPPLEHAIGHTFTNQAHLLESLTHASCQYDSSTQSYQRLEFLGDAVLDMLIVDAIRQHPRKLAQGDMTRIKHAVVNGNLLAFLCMEFGFEERTSGQESIVLGKTGGRTNGGGNGNGKGIGHGGKKREVEIPLSPPAPKRLHLYTYLRHNPSTPLLSNNAALSRHTHLREPILHAITTGPSYPWPLVSSLNADKFFSDIIESIIGAIFVDTHGDLSKCAVFIERLGITSYLNRILDERIDVLHPMQKAQIGLAKLASGLGVVKGFRFDFKTIRVLRSGGMEEVKEVTSTKDDKDEEAENDDDDDNDKEQQDDDELEVTGEEAEATYTCTITLAPYGLGLDDVIVSGAVSREDAEVRAAGVVVGVLEGLDVRTENEEEKEDKQDKGVEREGENADEDAELDMDLDGEGDSM